MASSPSWKVHEIRRMAEAGELPTVETAPPVDLDAMLRQLIGKGKTPEEAADRVLSQALYREPFGLQDPAAREWLLGLVTDHARKIPARKTTSKRGAKSQP